MPGSAISAFTPQTMVVSPRRTRAEPSAVDIDPWHYRVSAVLAGVGVLTHVDGYVSPSIKATTVWSDIFFEESFNVDAWMQTLKNRSVQTFGCF
jgi:hypothetical protein